MRILMQAKRRVIRSIRTIERDCSSIVIERVQEILVIKTVVACNRPSPSDVEPCMVSVGDDCARACRRREETARG